MAGRKFRGRKALFFAAILAGGIQLSGCGLAAMAIISRDTPISEKRELRAQVLGYQVFMEARSGESAASARPCGRISEFGSGHCLPLYDINAVHTPEFTLLEIRTGLNLDRFSENLPPHRKQGSLPEYGSVIRIFIYPAQGIYTFQGRTMDSGGQKVAERGFSAADPGTVFGSLGGNLGLPWLNLLDYLAGLRADECAPVSFREEQDFRLTAECDFRAAGHSGTFRYRVLEWTSFDQGLYFPKEFSVAGDSGMPVLVTVRGARELFREQRERGLSAAEEAAREITERISRGELPLVRDAARARELVREL